MNRIRVSAMPAVEYSRRVDKRVWIALQVYGVNLFLSSVAGALVSKGVHFGGGLGLRYVSYDPASPIGFEFAAGPVAEIGSYGPLVSQLSFPSTGTLFGLQFSAAWRYKWIGVALLATMGWATLGVPGGAFFSGPSVGVAPSLFVEFEF